MSILKGNDIRTLDTVIVNGLSYRTIFETNNTIQNPYFLNGTTSWNNYFTAYSNVTIENGRLKVTRDTSSTTFVGQYVSIVSGNTYYGLYDYEIITNTSRARLYVERGGGYINDNFSPDKYVSQVFNGTSTGSSRFDIICPSFEVTDTLYLSSVHLVNLTTLGISNLTKEQMDNYYEQYRLIIDNGGSYNFAPISAIYKGSPSYALSFDGVDDFIEIPYNSIMNTTNYFELEIEMSFLETPTTDVYILKNNFANYDWLLYQGSNGRTGFDMRTSTGEKFFSNDSLFGNDFNYNLIYDNGNVSVLLNGQAPNNPLSSPQPWGTPVTTNSSVIIGKTDYGSTLPFQLKYLKLTYDNGFIEYDLSEGSGNVLNDLGGNNVNANINGATWQKIYDNEIERVYKSDSIIYGGDIYQLLGDIIVNTNTTQIDFDNLNITKDDELLLVSTLVNTSGGNQNTGIYVNGNTTPTNYWNQVLYGASSTLIAVRPNNAETINGLTNDTKGFTISNIKISNNDKFVVQSQVARSIGIDSSSMIQSPVNCVSTFSVSSINSITIFSRETNAISQNSRFTLYKLNRGSA